MLNAAGALIDWLSTVDQWMVLLFTFLTSGIEMTFLAGLLVPGESVVMLAAALPDGPAGFAVVVLVGTAGALCGQMLGYAVGRVFGERLRGTRLGRRIGAERFDRAEAYLRERGAPALVAVRFVAVIHAVVPIVAGAVRMPFGRFLLWSGLGTALWVSAFATAGALTAGADATGGLGLVLTAVGATCLGAVPFAARLVRRAFTRHGGRATPVAAPVATTVAALAPAGPVVAVLATAGAAAAGAATTGAAAVRAATAGAAVAGVAMAGAAMAGPAVAGVVRAGPVGHSERLRGGPADAALDGHDVKVLQVA